MSIDDRIADLHRELLLREAQLEQERAARLAAERKVAELGAQLLSFQLRTAA